MTNYKLLLPAGVIRDDGAHVPNDSRNRDWLEYIEWLESGNIPAPADPVPTRKLELTPSQQIILADGIDVAKVTITGEPGATVEYTVNGEPFSTTLDASGSETIELTCDTPNTTLVVQAGTAKTVIYVVEVPA